MLQFFIEKTYFILVIPAFSKPIWIPNFPPPLNITLQKWGSAEDILENAYLVGHLWSS